MLENNNLSLLGGEGFLMHLITHPVLQALKASAKWLFSLHA